ncbi:tetratricopeptide repeat protein [Streptomyces sp. DSM 118148]|uniref:tetratricopeptide repeat protein n=1 Tax=Streptomyces sp. DSM 118148 TaxID=3448667 RepID=UPI00403FE197
MSTFQTNLERDIGADEFEFLFHVHGIAGAGKTSLVRQWDTMARDRYGAVTAFVDDDVHSAVEAMAAVSEQLSGQGCALKAFDKLLATYRQRRHEAETAVVGASAAETDGRETSASVSSTVVTQVGLVGLGMVPGLGPFSSAVDAKQLAQGADRLRVALSSRFRSHDDAHLVLSPLRVLTPVFVRELAEVAQRVPWVVLFFDTFEQTAPVLDAWLRDLLVEGDYGSLPLNVLVVLSGQGRLDARCWGDCLGLITEVPLDVFTEDEARQLLAAKGITDERLVEVILEVSGRLPVLVDTLAQARPGDPGAIGDPADTAVERFLKWIAEPAERAAVLSCALPLQLNEDIYRAAVGDPEANGYPFLRSLSFVTDHAGRCRYHQVVRGPMLRVQRSASPTQWSRDHTRLADTFQQWREALEATLPADGYWDDPHWRDLRLNQTYHQLCAQHSTTLSDVIHEVVQACDHGEATLRRWAQTVGQAGQDTGNKALTQLGHNLQGTGSNAPGVIPALTLLLTTPGITTGTRAAAHTIRGREHRNAKAYEAALTDYNAALAHDPESDRAVWGRGMTYELLHRYEEALADFDRALELKPDHAARTARRGAVHKQLGRLDDALTDLNHAIDLDPGYVWSFLQRGLVHQAVGRYDDALIDFNHAIDLDPAELAWITIAARGLVHRDLGRHDDALTDLNHAIGLSPDTDWLIASRGQTHQDLGRYDEALIDFNRAIDLDPDYAWALANRGQTYRLMHRYDDALTDLNRAIDLDPTRAWALANRGEIQRLMHRYDEALTDFDRAIDLDPDYAWAIASRGQTYRALGRYDEALTDFDHAIALDPDYPWASTERGEIHRLRHRYDEALTDFDRAIDLDPNDAWAIASRGQTHRLMQRYVEALADLDRAIDLDPDYAWAIASRGQTHRDLGRYDEALAEFDQAIALDPAQAWAFANRGETYRLMHRYDEAFNDFDRAIDLDPNDAWAIANRGETYRLMQRYVEALADLDRAIDLDPDHAWAITSRGQTYRALGRYDEALTDLDHAIRLDPEDAWAMYESAVVMRLSGTERSVERWHRAVEILQAESAGEGRAAVWAAGSLLVVLCGLPDWHRAQEQLEAFLSVGHSRYEIQDVLTDLADLRNALPVEAGQLDPIVNRLEEALTP